MTSSTSITPYPQRRGATLACGFETAAICGESLSRLRSPDVGCTLAPHIKCPRDAINVRGRSIESFHSRRAGNPSRAPSGSFLVRATLPEPPTKAETMTTIPPELPNALDEFPLDARTRRSLANAGITTLDALEQALLSEHPIRGIGPRGLEEIDRALDRTFEAIESEQSRAAAVSTILAERNRLAEALMATVDLLVEKDRQLNGPNLRKASAALMRGRYRPPTRHCRFSLRNSRTPMPEAMPDARR